MGQIEEYTKCHFPLTAFELDARERRIDYRKYEVSEFAQEYEASFVIADKPIVLEEKIKEPVSLRERLRDLEPLRYAERLALVPVRFVSNQINALLVTDPSDMPHFSEILMLSPAVYRTDDSYRTIADLLTIFGVDVLVYSKYSTESNVVWDEYDNESYFLPVDFVNIKFYFPNLPDRVIRQLDNLLPEPQASKLLKDKLLKERQNASRFIISRK